MDPVTFEPERDGMMEELKNSLLIANENEKWKILSQEVSLKQDLIAKFLMEYQEKQNSLKDTVNQINELK